MKETNNIENVEIEEIVDTEEKKEGILSKIGSGVKKHGKKVLAFAGIGALGFILGKATVGHSDDDESEENCIECTEYSVEDDN